MGSRAGGTVQIVCGHQSANESTHIAICVQKVASKTRGGVSKILTKMRRSIAVHLKLPSFIFWTFLLVSSLYRTSTAMAQHLLLKGTESRTGWEMQQLLWYQFGSIFHPLANILKIQRILKYKINQGKIQNGGQPYKAGPVAGQTFTFTDDLWWLPACLDSQALLPTTILNVAPL